MFISFNPHFIKPILKGIKIHTIRRDIEGKAKPGETLLLHDNLPIANGSNHHGFDFKSCVSTQTITITYIKLFPWYITGPVVKVDDRSLTPLEVHTLAVNDGFDNIEQFYNWFNTNFSGKIIHWTDKKY